MNARTGRLRELGPLLVAAAAALWLWPAPAPTGGAAVTAAALGELQGAAHALRAQASQLAAAPRTRAVLATDVETARDLSDEELGLTLAPGERVALAQRTGDAAPVLLVALPRDAAGGSLPLTPPGLQLMAADGQARLCAIASAEPLQPRPGLSASVSVCRTLALPATRAALAAEHAAGSLLLGGLQLELHASPGPHAAAQRVQVSAAGVSLTLLLSLREPGKPLPLTAAGWLLALGGVALWLGPRLAVRRTPPPRPSGPGTRALTPDAALPPASVPPLPVRLGRYELQERLGAGAMGEVYLARMHGEAGFERLVALKVVASVPEVQDLLLAHFLDEARLAARIHHPNVLDVLALEKLDGRYVIAMEYVDGADLASLLDAARQAARPVPLGAALRILSQVCAGVHAAHGARAPDGSHLELIHRDIKSANILISRAGAVKVGDFGVARAAQQHMLRATHNETVKGTIAYMAPEQQLRQPLDARSDQYAIGAVAYEMLSGRPIDLDVRRLLPRGTSDWPHQPALPELRADVPDALWQIVARALKYDKQDRFPDCAALQEALDAVAEQVPGVTDRAVAQWAEQLLAATRKTRAR